VASKAVLAGEPNKTKTLDFSEVFSRLDSNLVKPVSKLLPNLILLNTPSRQVVNWLLMLQKMPLEIDLVSKVEITET